MGCWWSALLAFATDQSCQANPSARLPHSVAFELLGWNLESGPLSFPRLQVWGLDFLPTHSFNYCFLLLCQALWRVFGLLSRQFWLLWSTRNSPYSFSWCLGWVFQCSQAPWYTLLAREAISKALPLAGWPWYLPLCECGCAIKYLLISSLVCPRFFLLFYG